MIKINRIFTISFLISLFLGINVYAQKVNQLDANGKRTGTWKKEYENGNIRYVGQFKNGKEIGTFKFYDITSSSQPTIIKEFSDLDGTALVKFYTLDGKIKSRGKMRGRNRIGKWLYYFPTGKVISEENYKEGKLDGVLKTYYENGKLTEETYYLNGLKHGASKVYTEEGILLEDVQYVEGKLHGEAKYYDLKGQLKEKGRYNKGKREGKWEFYMDGQLAKKKKTKLSEFKSNE